ncbi:hypothetical protein IT408_02900 [Candidatus Uhrbacteria bacterium]|nr:hypothetical protein [Candidatus Uhrbacteria bacterium]
MSDSISFLPEDLRKKEETQRQQQKTTPNGASDLKFSIPKIEQEDIEVIEIDEGEIEQVLANEPLIARIVYRAVNFFDEVRSKLFSRPEAEPIQKLPPQFFTPPSAKATTPTITKKEDITATGASTTISSNIAKPPMGALTTKARIVPMASAPRRVRVIKRVRKPVRVSFVSGEELRLMHIDIPKRRFTLIAITVMFCVLMGGGWYVLRQSQMQAFAHKQQAEAQLSDVRTQIQTRQKTWNDFQDLEPRLKALSGLLAVHISPTKLLTLIEDKTLPSVSYSSFSMTADGRVQLAVSADTIPSAARQIRSFQKSGFVKSMETGSYNVVYEGTDLTPKSVQFQLNLLLSPEALQVARPIAAAQ